IPKATRAETPGLRSCALGHSCPSYVSDPWSLTSDLPPAAHLNDGTLPNGAKLRTDDSKSPLICRLSAQNRASIWHHPPEKPTKWDAKEEVGGRRLEVGVNG